MQTRRESQPGARYGRRACAAVKTLSAVVGVALFVGYSAAAHGAEVQLRSNSITVSFNERMQRQIKWLTAESGNVVAFDPAVQEGVIVSGRECTAFRLDRDRFSQKRIVDPEFGAALQAVVAGVYRESGIAIEREVRLLLPEKYPDVAIFQSTYRNLGTMPIHLDRVFSQRILLDRKLAEPEEPSYAFASFQGGAYRWGSDYALIWLKPDFQQSNFQGAEDVSGVEGVGGGMPFIDVWGRTMGVALAHLEKVPQWVSLPVQVRPDERVEMRITESPLTNLGQQEWLGPGESYQTIMTAVIFHRLDFYDSLHPYGQLLRARGVAIPETSPPSAYEPYWKSWGWGRRFTTDKILSLLPELKSFGIRIANLDDGWYDYMGDWELNHSPGKFPNGDTDMKAFVRKVHDQGFKTNVWWYPLGVDPKSRLAKEHADLLVQDENGNYTLDPSRLYQLCPAYQPALQHIDKVLRRAVAEWGFDGVYTDFQGLSAVPACFNKAHHHRTPLDSFQAVPRVFEMIYKTLHELKTDPYHEVCICSLPHSPYNMPYYDIANASDPVNTEQVRRRIKLEKAIRGGAFAVGDCYQIPIQEWDGYSVPESFETAIGTGAQLTTFYVNLDERQKVLWNRWFHEYRDLGLSHAKYVNLYDLAFDKPEVHVVRRGEEMYYGIFAVNWPRNKPIDLRGLKKGTTYTVYDYGNRRDLGTIDGSDPRLRIAFKDSLLVRVRPVNTEGK
jgi:alpha-galactosidase